MQNNQLQTHIDTLYVCFLPSQVSQIRSLITKHKNFIESQYPLKDKTEPYFIQSDVTNFLFIPVKNMKYIDIQDVINLAIQISQMTLPHINIKAFDIHLDLLLKYLNIDHVTILETALQNKLDTKYMEDNKCKTCNLLQLPQHIVDRTLCLVNAEDVAMYEYILQKSNILLLYIANEYNINEALLSALKNSNVGLIFIQYKESKQPSQECIAFNGLKIITHKDIYHNICYDALHYAKQYRMQTVLIHDSNYEGKKAHSLTIKHNSTHFLSKLVTEHFAVNYHYANPPELSDYADLENIQNHYIHSIDSKLLYINFRQYPKNQAIFTYILKKVIESLDEIK
ncbi:hypothetical protein [Macrococcus animalis]|uniref:hypothetical protein n=1 Tax=Macrococcus animalis TaxID=3395467 RepID=UPI0039BDB948